MSVNTEYLNEHSLEKNIAPNKLTGKLNPHSSGSVQHRIKSKSRVYGLRRAFRYLGFRFSLLVRFRKRGRYSSILFCNFKKITEKFGKLIIILTFALHL